MVVIRYEGPRGGPGMQEMFAPTTAIKGMRLDDKVALVTDGRFSGGTAGACVGHVSPEAAAGGPIALLQPGDIIDIDVLGHTLSVRLSEAELAKRAAEWKPRPPRYTTGCLGKYASWPPVPTRRGAEVGLRTLAAIWSPLPPGEGRVRAGRGWPR